MGNAPGRWPDFLLLGAAKAGTTALFGAMTRHPQVHRIARKQPAYLRHPDVPPALVGPGSAQNNRRIVWEQAAYLALFSACPPGAITGEATTYLADEHTPATAGALVPRARLIAVLRHPVERAWSQYLHNWNEGCEPESSFEAAWDQDAHRRSLGWRPATAYQHRGYYAQHLTRWLAHFPREQCLILFYEDWRDRPVEVLAQVWRHLGVEPIANPVITRENVSSRKPRWPWLHRRMVDQDNPLRRLAQRALPLWARDAVTRTMGAANLGPGPRLNPSVRARLARTYHADLDHLETLTGRDLTLWRT